MPRSNILQEVAGKFAELYNLSGTQLDKVAGAIVPVSVINSQQPASPVFNPAQRVRSSQLAPVAGTVIATTPLLPRGVYDLLMILSMEVQTASRTVNFRESTVNFATYRTGATNEYTRELVVALNLPNGGTVDIENQGGTGTGTWFGTIMWSRRIISS